MEVEKKQAYDKFLEEKHELFQKLLPLNEENNWELEHSKDGFVIYSKKDSDVGLKYVRSEITINSTPEKILELLDDHENYHKWDKSVEKVELIEKTKDYKMVYNLTAPPAILVARRDFVSLASIRKQDDGSYIYASGSYNLDERPPVNSIVRAEVLIYGMKFIPEGEKTKVTMVLLINPKGYIPKLVLNAFCKEQASSMLLVKDLVEGKKKLK